MGWPRLPTSRRRSNRCAVRVTAPGIVPHVFPLPGRPGNNRVTLKLGRPARLAGSVFNDSGQPAANVPVEVWVENMYYTPSNPDGNPRPAGVPSLIHFDSGPIRTGADGSFRTPPQLMTGWSYRIVIRPEGDAPVNSDSLTARTELTTVPPLRLQQRRKLIGLVHDRQGQPVAGARVFLPSGEPRPRRMPRAASCWKASFPTGPTCWSGPKASGSRAGRLSRPDNPRSGSSPSSGRANRPTAR